MHDQQDRPAAAKRQYGLGIDDAIILPLVALAVAAKTLLRWAWSLLVHILDYAFLVLLQVARFVLFTLRILGDGVSALLRFVIKFLPLPAMRRQSWREAVARVWSWLRRKISYRVFEEWLHHLFEDGMAWVFRTCRRLSPGGALLVILAAMVWMPVSFLAATAVHTWLITEAARLPAWMQVFHAVATILAKSKLLMLPAYPAAWPQAKKHPVVQAGTRVWRFVANLRFVRKTIFRFGQTEAAATRVAEALGLVQAWTALHAGARAASARIGAALRAALRAVSRRLETLPAVGPVFRTYAAHYDLADAQPSLWFSERVKLFIKRWEIKFTPAYYETKDEAVKPAAASPGLTAERPRTP